MIYQICDVMMSISTWDWVYFWMYLLNCYSLTTKLGQLIDVSKADIFLKSSERFGGLDWVPGPFQFSNLLQLHNNQFHKVSSVSFFWKGE